MEKEEGEKDNTSLVDKKYDNIITDYEFLFSLYGKEEEDKIGDEEEDHVDFIQKMFDDNEKMELPNDNIKQFLKEANGLNPIKLYECVKNQINKFISIHIENQVYFINKWDIECILKIPILDHLKVLFTSSNCLKYNILLDPYYYFSVIFHNDPNMDPIFDFFHEHFHGDYEAFNCILYSISSILFNKDIFLNFFFHPIFEDLIELLNESFLKKQNYDKYTQIFISQLEYWKVNNIQILLLLMETDVFGIIIHSVIMKNDEALLSLCNIFNNLISIKDVKFGLNKYFLDKLLKFIKYGDEYEEEEEEKEKE